MLNKTSFPLVSAIIPTYNRSGYLEKAVRSVLAQDYPYLELVIVDDGSTDDTEEILTRFGSRIRYFYQSHQGVSAARNMGFQVASGDLLAFLDSDDLWKPSKTSIQVNYFRENPNTLICQTEEVWFRKGIRVNPRHKHRMEDGWIFQKCLKSCVVSLSSTMFKRGLIEEVGYFDPAFPVCEDYDYWLRIAYRYPIHLIPRKLIIKHGGRKDQLSLQFKGQDKYRILSIIKLMRSGCLNQEQYQQALEELREKCRIYGNGCLKRGKIREGEYYLGLPGSFNTGIS
ncbi:glycosyltransferase family 2 protein [bacterium]|nr:glycosyltransferase family 2 protein [bacterium]